MCVARVVSGVAPAVPCRCSNSLTHHMSVHTHVPHDQCLCRCRWLGCGERDVMVFGPEYRPVPLETHVQSAGDERNNYFLFERALRYKVPKIISKHAEGVGCGCGCGVWVWV